ncbi:hypothetical protein [Hyunsoonleella aestuarii]|uniref:Signal peptidase n=1 Tax=Hyunsoonleella aestuarii TaxID=912802 RepID=A0ABP8E9V8_9FLAO|nr:hypothetical protein [Hyunsoonleella aestuarii]
MTLRNKRIFASILFVLISVVCIAQQTKDGNNPPQPLPPPPPPGLSVGVDATFLICLALIYGTWRLLKKDVKI